MREIRELPWNGLNVVSTFSGCGGSSLGYKMAGFKVLWASEFISAAQDTYRRNHPSTHLDTRDIRTVRPADILAETELGEGEIDLFDGSPPCAAFSTSGKREAGWGKVKAYSDTKQRVDDLFFEYSRLVRGLRPKTFVAENVSGLVKGTAKGYFKRILAELRSCGYRVGARLLDAQWLGVPQMRQRLIFVGVREDLETPPVFPRPLPYRYSMREALEGLPPADLRWDTGDPKTRLLKVLSKGTMTRQLWEGAVPGDTMGLARGFKRLYGREAFMTHFRLSPERPSHTVLQARPVLYHWSVPRTFTIAELKRMSGFPDDFELTGTYDQQWERLGRAVPPVMMAHVARTIRDQVLKEVKG
jgi:DNA (cytosine-5)-methyltransferase 1